MFIIYLLLIILMSFVTYIAYGIDKKRATKDPKHRIREKTLLLMSFIFGSFGGLLGMYGFHHKTKHWYFVFINWFSLAVHLVLFYFIYKYFGFTGFALK